MEVNIYGSILLICTWTLRVAYRTLHFIRVKALE